MTLDEYQKLAARTASMDVPRAVQQFTFTAGLVCETVEVASTMWRPNQSHEAIANELGDVLWYAAAICTEYGLSMGAVAGFTFDDFEDRPSIGNTDLLIKRLVMFGGRTSDYLKKVIGHGHELNKILLADHLHDVIGAVADLCQALEMPMIQVAEVNIEKLRARYPEGFSSERSINRIEVVEGEPPVRKPPGAVE